MYRASVVKVMIATPGDVAKSRQIIRDVIHEWNVVHSEPSSIVLLPVGWDTHAYPSMDGRAQGVLNEQILKGCDLLVAAFWTRLGSPTGEAPSGSVEEIREHRKTGKPAMLYFSVEPVRRDSVDDDQYNSLREFRKECEAEGLIDTYESTSEFREKFTRQLAAMIRDRFSGAGDDEIALELSQLLQGGARRAARVEETLSDAAKELLLEASIDSDGTILRTDSNMGVQIDTNNREFVGERNARNEAKWDAALQELVEAGLVKDRGYQGEVFGVTNRGFEVADLLKG